MEAPICVVMGVSGSGKSTVAREVAARLGVDFLEGDELHPPRNVALMAAGVPLTDADRDGWLRAIAARMAQARASGRGLVVACSALKRAYRDILRQGAPGLRLVHLHGGYELLAARMAARSGHYMPGSLLESQFETLEPPGADEHALAFDVAQHAHDIVDHIIGAMRAASPEDAAAMSSFTKVILFTDSDGRARFREEAVPLAEGTPQAMLSALMPSGGYQLRESPVGFRSQFHCTPNPQWVFILGGQMEIGLQGGASRVFSPGEHFYSADVLPEGATFDASVHGHWSRQVGPHPLITLFVRG